MRLKCPNCGAEYEIDAAMIPEAGRDVQCAACGHGWFQEREGTPKDSAALLETLQSPPPPPPPPATPEPEPNEPEAPLPDTGAFLTPDRRSLDPAVRKVLEEEAARERRARVAETGGAPLETQGDLGLDPPKSTAKPSEGVFGGAATGLATPKTSRASSLPDIDEINSSLRATAERDPRTEAAAQSPQDRSRKRGFRLGFGLALMVFIAAVLAYGNAPRLAGQFPELRDPLARYVDRVNGFRDSVDSALGSGAQRLDSAQ